jgi:isopentenyl diphosphate isomerase/L-lactate dehydrogenase-like FMN-dependent dehydrogenase
MTWEESTSIADVARAAVDVLPPGTYGYYAGGAGDERTLEANVAAYGRHHLRPRVLVDVSATSAATTVLGTPVSMPLLVAPTALQRMAHPDGEPGTARAAAAAGTIFTLSTLASSRPSEVAAHAPADAPRWFQLYLFRDGGITRALCEEAVAHGFGAVVLTVDAPRAGRRERDLRTGFVVPPEIDMPAVRAALGRDACPTPAEFFSIVDRSVTWETVAQLARDLPVPLVLKGIQTAEDAALACEHGVAAIVVSNHGGRQLDTVGATIDLLPEIVEAVAGRIEVYVDGGVRRGTDVLVALALGARAVLVGRPILWGLAVGGEAGVRRVLELLHEEIELGLTLLGAPSPAHVTSAHVARPSSCTPAAASSTPPT